MKKKNVNVFPFFLVILYLFIPAVANAVWYDPLVKFAQEFRTAVIILGGVAAVSSMVYVGVCWMISRMAGTMDTTMMDYVKHVGVIGCVGGGGCFGGLGLLALGWGDFLMHTQANLSFDSHNAMARVAMFCGIPLFPLIFLVIGAAVGLFSGVYFFGWWGLGFSFPFLGGICGMRMLCSRDDKAIRRYFFHRKRQRLNKAYGRHLVITPRTLQWREKYVRRLVKKNLLAGAS